MDCYPYFPHSLPDLVENRHENLIDILLISVAYVLKISVLVVRKFFSGRQMSRGFPKNIIISPLWEETSVGAGHPLANKRGI